MAHDGVHYAGGFKQTSIVKVENTWEGNKRTTVGRDKDGNVVKESIFIDRNNDGKFDDNEIQSVRYYDYPGSKCGDYTEYRDLDGDGTCDEKEVYCIDAKFTEEVKPDIHGKPSMINMYGYTDNADGPMPLKGQ